MVSHLQSSPASSEWVCAALYPATAVFVGVRFQAHPEIRFLGRISVGERTLLLVIASLSCGQTVVSGENFHICICIQRFVNM